MWLSIYIIEKLILANIDTNHSIALTCMNCGGFVSMLNFKDTTPI